jgi:hypothetical protein
VTTFAWRAADKGNNSSHYDLRGAFVFFFFCAPYVFQVVEEPRRFIYRAGAALLILGVIWVQGRLYHSVASWPQPTGNLFLTAIYGMEHFVGLLLLIRAALMARAREMHTG